MKWVSHMVVGMSVAMGTKADTFGTGAIILGSLLPDLIDQSITRFMSGGKKFDREAYAYYWKRIHRKLSHYFPIPLLLGVLSFNVLLIDTLVNQWVFYLSIGMISHIFIDAFNSKGVPLYPLKRRLRFMNIIMGSKQEYMLVGLIICLAMAAYNYGYYI